jgi:hypothetical protein
MRMFRAVALFAVFAAAISALTLCQAQSDPPGQASQPPAHDPAGARNDFFRRRSPDGHTAIDPASWERAFKAVQSLPQYSTATGSVSAPAGSGAPLTPSAWESIGPTQIGGRTRALIINPGNGDILYAAGADGGVFTSSDAGLNWAVLGESSMPQNLAVNSLAYVVDAGDVLYAGTGEGYFNDDAVRGNGIYKWSTGAWVPLGTTAGNSEFWYVNKLAISRITGNPPPGEAPYRVYAATRTGVHRSTDRGLSWTKIFPPTNVTLINGGALDIVVRTDKTDGTDEMVVSMGTRGPYDGVMQAALYHTSDARKATTDPNNPYVRWTLPMSEAGMGRTSLAIAPGSQGTIYALSAESSDTNRDAVHAIFKSVNGGASFSTNVVNTSIAFNTFLLSNNTRSSCQGSLPVGYYAQAIAVSPTNPSQVWVGGVDLYRSDDGGANWGQASAWQLPPYDTSTDADKKYVHEDKHVIVFDPFYDGGANQIMFVATDGGIYRTDLANGYVETHCPDVQGWPLNFEMRWYPRNNGFAITQFYHGLPYPDASLAFGGTQDNGSLRKAGTFEWGLSDPTFTGDWEYVGIGGVSNGRRTVFAAQRHLNLYRSTTDGAPPWTFVSSGTPTDAAHTLGDAPFVLDPNVSTRLWSGGKQLFRSANSADTWATASTTFTGFISSINVSPFASGNSVLATTSDGYVASNTSALSANATTAWTLSQPITGQNVFVSNVAVDPKDSSGNTAYATVSAFTNDVKHVFKSISAFGSPGWTSISDSIGADLPVNWVLPDRVAQSSGNRLWIGTDTGVLTSTNGGTSWFQEATTFPSAIVESLSEALGTFPNPTTPYLYAFTHGRGAYRVPVSYIHGDVNNDGLTNVNDVFYLINATFAGGSPPVVVAAANVNGDTTVDVLDVFYLINYLFSGGPAPLGPAGGGAPNSIQTASDKLQIGTVSTTLTSGTIKLPVYIQDNSGTSIGRDKAAGYRISDIGFEVTYGQNSCVNVTGFDKTTGVLNGMTTDFESTSLSPNTKASFVFSTTESGGVIPLVSNTLTKIGSITFVLNGCSAQTIQVTPTRTGQSLAALGCDLCSATQQETTTNGGLTATSGSITIGF